MEILENLFEMMLKISLSTSLAIFLVYLARNTVLKKISSKMALVLWIPILFQLLVPIQWKIPIANTTPNQSIPRFLSQAIEVVQERQVDTAPLLSLLKTQTQSSTTSISPLSLLWIMGMLVQVVYLVWCLVQMKKWLKRATPCNDERLLMKMKRFSLPSKCLILKDFHGASITLSFPFQFIVGEKVSECTEEELDLLLHHESVHWKNHHPQLLICLRLLRLVYWLFPLVWLMVYQIEQELEYWADESVLETHPEKAKVYAQLLFTLQTQPPLYKGIYLSRKGKKMKERLTRIIHCKDKKQLLLPTTLIALAVCVCLIYFESTKIPESIQQATIPQTKNSEVSNQSLTNEEFYAALVVPVENPVITCGWHCDLNHEAIDVKNEVDLYGDIVAVYDGTVIETGTDEIDGYYIIPDHGENRFTHYNTLGTIDCVVGQTIAAGEKIATIGNSGTSTGPHLEFELFFGDEPYNAESLFERG